MRSIRRFEGPVTAKAHFAGDCLGPAVEAQSPHVEGSGVAEVPGPRMRFGGEGELQSREGGYPWAVREVLWRAIELLCLEERFEGCCSGAMVLVLRPRMGLETEERLKPGRKRGVEYGKTQLLACAQAYLSTGWKGPPCEDWRVDRPAYAPRGGISRTDSGSREPTVTEKLG